jgi:hypothetical protein
VPQPAIRAIIRDHKDRPISDPTFRKHFRKEINTAATELQGSKRGPSIWVSSRAGPEKLQPRAAFLPAGPAR